jgi:outer membrane lipase/esterase
MGGAGLGRTDMDTVRATGFAPRNTVTGQLVVDHSFTALEAGLDFAASEIVRADALSASGVH